MDFAEYAQMIYMIRAKQKELPENTSLILDLYINFYHMYNYLLLCFVL